MKTIETGATQQFRHHRDDFGIYQGRLGADRLGADLIELAETALLWALPAEHRADVVILLDARNLVEPVLDVGADHRGGGFRAQGKRAAVAILEGVHLLADDVGVLADAAREQ